MSIGHTPMRLRLALAFAFGLTAPVAAEPVAMGCDRLAALFQGLTGYGVTLPPSPTVDGWCVAEGATLRAGDLPRISVERLELAGSETGDGPESLSLRVGRARIAPQVGDRSEDAVLRSVLRLQTVDATLTLQRSAERDGLELRDVRVALSGGTELLLEAELSGGGFSRESLALATLTGLRLDWRNDGRLLRPVMEAAGGRLAEGATGNAAVDAAREALRRLLENLPITRLAGDTASELDSVVAALPQGRGRMVLDFTSEAGLGAARIGPLALSDDPSGVAALARLLADAVLTVDWQPGLGP